MKRCRIKLEIELEIDAYTINDAVDLAKESVYDLDGLGVGVINVTVTDQSEQ
jgi:hypothetical protein